MAAFNMVKKVKASMFINWRGLQDSAAVELSWEGDKWSHDQVILGSRSVFEELVGRAVWMCSSGTYEFYPEQDFCVANFTDWAEKNLPNNGR